MNPTRMTSFVFAVLATVLGTGRTVRAQSAEAMREIQEIATKVDEQLREIDRLLLESSKKNQARSKPKELLEQAKQRSEAAEGGIDQLIEKLQQMKQQSSSSSSESQEQEQQQQDQQQQQQQGQQQRQQQQQGQQNRRENQTPDFVKQPPQPGEQEGQQQGQQQGQQPQGQQQGQPQQPGEQPQEQLGPDGKPLGGQESKDGGQNRTGNRSPNDPTGPGNPGQGEGSWGELQSYVNFLKNKGSAPKVPEKYRKYWEAYLKQKQGTGSSGGGSTGR